MLSQLFEKVKQVFKGAVKIESHKYSRHIKKFLDGKLRPKQTRILVERIGLNLFNKLAKI